MKRTPLKKVSVKRAAKRASSEGQEDLAYMGKVRSLPCAVCVRFGLVQTSPTDAHHPFHGRYSTAKEDDKDAIPLCKCHHQGLRFDRDRTKLAIHQGKESWLAAYGPDYSYIDGTVEAINGEIDF